MKHVFIVNPKAGRKDAGREVAQSLAGMSELDYEIYVTRFRKDATHFVHDYCSAHPAQKTRFYACGGDGTIGEVANGIVGFDNASMSCYPCGSGNDYVKSYGGKERFLDIPRLIRGKERDVDLMRVNDRWCVNVFDVGFDSWVCNTMTRVKRKPIIGGKNAYFTGVAQALLHAMRTPCRIEADGEELTRDSILLCTVANGSYVGGSFCCAPRAKTDDGLLEVCMVRPVSRMRFLRLAGIYRRGEHLEHPELAHILEYRRASRVRVSAQEPFWSVLDGELLQTDDVHVEAVPRAIRFAIPE